MSPRLCIIDTNVLVAGLITSDLASPTARILDGMLDGRLLCLLSPALLDEYRTVLLRPRLCRVPGLTEVELDSLLADITANAVWREPSDDVVHHAPDSGDAHLWALLASEASSVLVTGDRLLLESPRPGSVLMTPAECLSFFRD